MTTVKGPDSAQDQRLKSWIDQYQSMLLKTCYLYLHDAALAEDAVQETFIKAYRGMNHFHGECADRTWLTQIAINTCRDMLRGSWFQRIDRKVTPDELPEQSVPDHAENILLAAEVMNLPRKLREVIILYYYQNMEGIEIAEALHISQPAVSTRLKRAREKLRACMNEGRDSHAK